MRASFEQSDEELWRLAVAGDAEAFAALYRRRQAGIFRFAFQMCGSETVAEDVTQEVFMTLIGRETQMFDPARGTVSGYLYGIARKQVLRRLDKERRFVAIADERAEGTDARADETVCESATCAAPFAAGHDPLADLTRHELIETVRQAVLSLPAHYREVVVLCEFHELSYTDAAQTLGCAVGTVRSRLSRARALLHGRLQEARTEVEPERAPVDPLRCFA